MKSRMVKRILATLLAVVFLAGDVLPTVASDVEGSTQVIKEAEEEASSLWEDVTPAEDENKENESETPATTETPAATETPATTEPTETEEKTEASTEEAELTEIGEGETPLADGLDEEAEEEELDEEILDEEALEEEAVEEEEEERVTLAPVTVDDVTITVSGSKDAFVEGTYVSAVEVDPIKVEELVEDAAEETQTVVKTYKAFDITLKIKNEDGEEEDVQPLNRESVKVSFEGDMLIPDEAAGETVTVYHVDDNLTTIKEEMSSEVVTVTDEDTNQTTDVVEMETTHFSIFVISVNSSDRVTAKWKLVDSTNTSKVLTGAEFKITRYQKKSDYPSGISDMTKDNNYTSTARFTNGVVSFDIVESDRYFYCYVLEETTAPDGYDIPDNKWYIVPYMWSNHKQVRVYDSEEFDDSDNEVDYFIGSSDNIEGCYITNSPESAATYSVKEASKNAVLIDWENKIYRIDLSTYVESTTNKTAKVVIVADTSASMMNTDAVISRAEMNSERIYFTVAGTNSDSEYDKAISVKSTIQSYLPIGKGTDGKYYNIRNGNGYNNNYVFNVGGTWYQKSVSHLNDSNPLSLDGAASFTGQSAYTNRSELFVIAAKKLVEKIPDGTKIQLIKFGNNASRVGNTITLDTNARSTINGYIEGCVGEYGQATYPKNGFSMAQTVFDEMGGQDKNCYLVYFADGKATDGENGTNTIANNLKKKKVTIYAVGLDAGSLISSVVSEPKDTHKFTPSNMTGLLSAFETIGGDIGDAVRGTMTDVISDEFVVVDGSSYEALSSGTYNDVSGDSYSVSSGTNGQIVSWNNIEINCNTTYTKSVYIKAKDDFIGGNLVNTNAGSSFNITLSNEAELTPNGSSTGHAESASVNVKTSIEPNDQSSVVKRGKTLENILTTEFVKNFTKTEAEGNVEINPENFEFYDNEECSGEPISLETLKHKTLTNDKYEYWVKVKATPKAGFEGSSIIYQLDDSFRSSDSDDFVMERNDAEGNYEASAIAKYTIKVEGLDLQITAIKDSQLIDWDNRTYQVNLGAETKNKVTHYESHSTGDTAKVIFVLDTSSSMRGTKLSDLKTAANGLIAELAKSNAEIAAFSFNAKNNAKTVISGYKKLSTTDNSVAEAQAAINSMTTSYGTHAAYGLDKALGILNNGENKNTFLIFFTDGELNDESNARTMAQKIRDKGVTMYGITLGGTTKDEVISEMTGNQVYHADSSADLAGKFTSIGEEIEEATGSTLESIEVGNITIYDEISKYFDLTDESGNVLTDDASVKAFYGENAKLGTKGGLTTITFENQSSEKNSEGKAIASQVIYLKAKPEFAGGNQVPTNGEFKVTVANPDKPSEIAATDNISTSPVVNVKFEAKGGTDQETIFLGETLGEYWTTSREAEIKSNLYADNYKKPTVYDFLDMENISVEWFKKLDSEGKPIEPVSNMKLEAPEKDGTKYYAKLTIKPKYADDESEYAVRDTEVIGVYTVYIVTGEIKVNKVIENPDTAKALSYDGNPIFTFVLKKKVGNEYTAVQTKVINFGEGFTGNTSSVTFTKLGAGEYVVEELDAAGWVLSHGYQKTSNTMSLDNNNKTGECSFRNKAVKQTGFADKDVVVNSIKVEDGQIKFYKNGVKQGN